MASTKPAPGVTPWRLTRKLLLGLLGLVGFALLVLALFPYIVSLDSVKAQIVAHIEAALQRKVDVGAVRLQLLGGPGVGLEEVIIYNPPGWQQPYFIKASTLSVKAAWRPLLRRQIEITTMRLSNGEIVIERDAQGRMNFADLAVSNPAPAKTLPAPIQPATSGGGARSGMNPLAGLSVSDATLQHMQITFVDRMVVPGQEIITAVRDFQLHVNDAALGRPIPIDMTATMLTDGSQNIRLRGRIGPIPESLALESVPIDVHLRATDVLLDKLTPYLGGRFPLGQGRLEGDLRVQGSIASSLHINGALALADAVLHERFTAYAANALPKLTSTQDITVDLPTGRAELTHIELNVSSLQAVIEGVVHTFTTAPQLDLRLATNTIAPGELLTQFPRLAAMLPTPTDLRGKAQLQATFKGAPHDLRAEAQIDLQEVALRHGAFTAGTPGGGGLWLETDKANARLVAHMVSTEPPHVHLDVGVQRLTVDQQGIDVPAPTRDLQPDPITKTSDPTTKTSESKPMLPSLLLSGNVRVAEGHINSLDFQQLTADFTLLKGLLKATHQMTLYGGSSQGAMQVDLTQSVPSYSLDAKVAGLDVAQAVNSLTPAKNVLLGVLDTDMRLAGRGFAWDVINKTLSGDGHVKLAEAQLTSFDLLPKLVQLLRNAGGLVGFTIPSGWEHNSVRVIEGDWHLRQGKILTDRLRLRGEGMEVLMKGYLGLDRSIDYAGSLFLPAKFITLRGLPTMLRHDEAGRVAVPFTVKGTVAAPQIAFHEKALVDLAKEELADTVRKWLDGKIEELSDKPSAGEQPHQKSEETGPDPGDRPIRQNWPGKILQDLFRR